jgi:acetyltransferase-like isoleucine patch superfamily enzyme
MTMVASLNGRATTTRDRLDYYVNAQATGWSDYLWQGLLTTLCSWVPGLVGIGLRGIIYRLLLQADGFAAIEGGVRLRHARHIRLGAGVYLDRGVYLHACPNGIDIGAGSVVMHNSELHVFNFRDLPHAFIKIGCGTFVGESVVIRGQGGVTIGDSVLIGPMAKILAVNHTFTDITRPVLDQGITGQGIVIDDGAWIGAGAAILDGVRIGKGAVVGANAVVTWDVPPHTVAVGSPARVIRRLDPHASSTPITDAWQTSRQRQRGVGVDGPNG